jgi:hypothetical protein
VLNASLPLLFQEKHCLTLPLMTVLGSAILLHVGLIGPTMMMTLHKTKNGCVGLICPTAMHTDLYNAFAGKVVEL